MCAVPSNAGQPVKRKSLNDGQQFPAYFLTIIGRTGLVQRLKHLADLFVYARTPNLTHKNKFWSPDSLSLAPQ